VAESFLPPAVDEPAEPRAPAEIVRRYDYSAEALARALGLTGKVTAIQATAESQTWHVFTQEGDG
jgi:hypothetical protein